jgi:hypothetical protein
MEKASTILLENRKNLGTYLILFGYLKGNNVKLLDLNLAVDLQTTLTA